MRPTVRRRLTVAALFVVSCGIATPLAAFGVFLPVLAEAFGWSRGAISTALSINLVLGGLARRLRPPRGRLRALRRARGALRTPAAAVGGGGSSRALRV